jgi:hypothetical protein
VSPCRIVNIRKHDNMTKIIINVVYLDLMIMVNISLEHLRGKNSHMEDI